MTPGENNEYDIYFRTINSLRTVVQALTPKGYLWIRENMEHKEDFTVTVNTDLVSELKEEMRKAGLRV